MTSEPRIIVVEDELPQILALRAIVEPLGEVTDFRNPEEALEHLKTERMDAAIVDIHMGSQLNGLQLIRAVRAFDRDLAIIIHTGDTSIEVAEDAIELQAFRRAIKCRTSVAELRNLVRAAIEETRARRSVTEAARATVEISREFEVAMSSIDDELTAAECHQGILRSTRNAFTSLSGLAEALSILAQESGDRSLQAVASQNKALIERQMAELQAFLDGPFADAQPNPGLPARTDVNATLDALGKRFAAANVWVAERKTLQIAALPQSFLVAAQPLKLLSALRHAAEFCLQQASSPSEVSLRPVFIRDIMTFLATGPSPLVVFNRPERSSPVGHIVFTLQASVVATDLETIRQSFHRYPDDPRMGNLHVIPLALGERMCSVGVSLEKATKLSLHLCLPVAQ